MTEIYAFINGSIAGTFSQSQTGAVTFEYDVDHGPSPISLSLPRDEKHAQGAALAYLDNLLPDHQDVRERWARARELSGADPFTLLAAYGEDVAGAVSLSSDPDHAILASLGSSIAGRCWQRSYCPEQFCWQTRGHGWP